MGRRKMVLVDDKERRSKNALKYKKAGLQPAFLFKNLKNYLMQNNEKILTPSVTLQFIFQHEIGWFDVEFESDSPERNRPMRIEHKSFNLDLPSLVKTHPRLYKYISARMKEEAVKYWAVNEQKSEIPTLAYQPGMKLIAVLFFLCFSFSAFCQDTIPARKVKIAENVGISMRDGHVMYAHPRWRKVKSGFIIKKSDRLYVINGREYKPGNHKPLKIKK